MSWSVPERLGCDFVPSVGGDQYKARYLRIFASMEPELTSKWTPLAVMFVPFGHYVDDYTAFSNSFAPVPCTGHQVSNGPMRLGKQKTNGTKHVLLVKYADM